jgi:peptidoglycan/LPS O-acetylase OafA/YrhL
MRAVAVVAVVIYHLWPMRLPGGFVGVDVFFVISGFLIVGNLLRESESTGRIRVGAFWARRARRLLPASLTVLAVVAVAVYLWIPQSLWMQYLREVIASTLYVQNWVLAADAVDYLAQNNTASPVQHYWTLSVEEQFYILTPVLMIVTLVWARRARWSTRTALFCALAAITVASFVASVWMTSVNPPAAYFVTTTRAWEFGVGGLLAFAPAVRSRGWGTATFLLGAAGIIAASLLLSSSVPFPSAVAAWPVLASAAMIVGGSALVGQVTRVVALRPIQFVGDVSYSAYLWHWPIIVLLPWVTGHPLTTVERVGILVATFVLAALSLRFIENPVRTSSRLLAHRGAVVIGAWGIGAMAIVIGIAGVGLLSLELRRAPVEPTVAANPCFGAPAGLDRACDGESFERIVPDPVWAGDDDPNRDDCWAGAEDAELDICTIGPEDADVTIAAIGDSHNNALIPAFESIAEEFGWRIDVAGHNGCYWTAVEQIKPVQAQRDACEAWKQNLRDHFDSEGSRYDAILVTSARITLPPEGDDPRPLEVEGLIAEWGAAPAPVIVLRDVPRMRDDILACVTANLDDPNRYCATDQGEALGDFEAQLEAAAAAGAPVVDLTDVYCRQQACNPVIGGVLAYRDPDHLTGTFARTLGPILGERVALALDELGGSKQDAATR